MENLLARLPDMIGTFGVIITLVAYYFLSTGSWQAASLKYVLLNLFGALFLLISLMFHWNMSCAIIEVVWIGISVVGLVHYFKSRRPSKD
jgi:hypothetical protein